MKCFDTSTSKMPVIISAKKVKKFAKNYVIGHYERRASKIKNLISCLMCKLSSKIFFLADYVFQEYDYGLTQEKTYDMASPSTLLYSH